MATYAALNLGYFALLQDIPKRTITSSTIDAMHRMARTGKSDWAWVKHITQMVAGCASKDYYCEAKTVFDSFHDLIWNQNWFRYIRDPHQVELVESPWQLYLRRASDCDGWASLMAAAAGAIGAPYRFVTIAADPNRPADPSHVYTEIWIPRKGQEGRWVGADLTVKSATFGWRPPPEYKRTYWREPKY